MVYDILTSRTDNFVVYIVLALALVVSMVLHEYAHGITAYWNGDLTAKVNGRLTLNPVKHFDIMGFIMLFTVGFGYAKPVPVNPYNFKHPKKGIFTVSIAGVTVNLILAFICALFVCLFLLLLNTASAGAYNFVFVIYMFFSYMVIINLNLLFFNLLPIAPLDGFHVVEAFTKRNNKYCAFMRENGQWILLSLIGLTILVSIALQIPNVPYWVQYFDILGMYIRFFAGNVANGFIWFWRLIVPV